MRGWGYAPVEAGTVSEALQVFNAELPSLVLLDINLPDGSGLDVLREIKRLEPQAIVIMITTDVLVKNTIAAIRGGAYDFIGKPINLDELEVRIHNGIEADQLRREVNLVRLEQSSLFSFDQILGQSEAMTEMVRLARKIAGSEASSVLLQGESGSGKDLVAKAIHYGSSRAGTPLVTINCAAIPASLMESEFFGYEKGAFTDAKTRKPGMLEQAEGGTLFLDEIGELEMSLQAKLLRVLEEGAFRRVGGLEEIPLDVRVIAASNRDLKADSEVGRFRLDLYYRLAILQIDIPPLRERGDDVIVLAKHFIERFSVQLRKQVRSITGDVAEIFRRYSWPGNVRELRNVIERAMILEEGPMITRAYLPRDVLSNAAVRGTTAFPTDQMTNEVRDELSDLVPLPLGGIALDQVEMSLVRQALARSEGNQSRAARMLGITRGQLRYRLRKIEEADGKH